MVDFMRAGGYPIWIVLALSIPMLYLGVRFAIAADARRLALLRGLTWAQVFAVGSGVTSNVVAVMWHFGRAPDDAPALPRILIGLGEALTPAVLGLTMLSVTWILISFGLRRTPRSELER
jgi:hypothetical protein